MTKVIGFANIGDFDGYRYIATNHREDDNSGSYVALADYNQNIELQNNTIKAQQVEIETLKGLLSRWLDTQEITLTATFYPGMMEKYESVISDTEKVLK